MRLCERRICRPGIKTGGCRAALVAASEATPLPASSFARGYGRTSQPGFYRAAPMAGRPCFSRRNNMKPDGKNGTAHLPSSISKTEIGAGFANFITPKKITKNRPRICSASGGVNNFLYLDKSGFRNIQDRCYLF